jgi:hypothetical protein
MSGCRVGCEPGGRQDGPPGMDILRRFWKKNGTALNKIYANMNGLDVSKWKEFRSMEKIIPTHISADCGLPSSGSSMNSAVEK